MEGFAQALTSILAVYFVGSKSSFAWQHPVSCTTSSLRCDAQSFDADTFWEEHSFREVDRLMEKAFRSVDEESAERTFDPSFENFYNGFFTSKEREIDTKPLVCAGRHPKRTFKFRVIYCGEHFCGWQRQKQHELPSVQATLEDSLGNVLGEHVNIRVSGRTDAGVNAIGQLARIKTRLPVTASDIAHIVNKNPVSPYCRVYNVEEVPGNYHPTFQATSRSYVYVLDADHLETHFGVPVDDIVSRINLQLKPLVGAELDYIAVSYGKVKTETTKCTLTHARARSGRGILAVELTANRFLRRMVRILVATVIEQVLAGEPNGLVSIIGRKRRDETPRPAPAQGLVFVSATTHTTSR